MDWFLIVICLLVVAGSLYIGFRIGRAVGVSSASRQSDFEAGRRTAAVESAVEAAVRTNEQTAEVIRKMRDILEKHSISNDSSDGNDSGSAESK